MPTIHVKSTDGKSISLDVSLTDPIQNVKSKIFESVGIPPEQQILSYSGKQLLDGTTLGNYQVADGSTVYLIIK